jgi:hypothetical protein
VVEIKDGDGKVILQERALKILFPLCAAALYKREMQVRWPCPFT